MRTEFRARIRDDHGLAVEHVDEPRGDTTSKPAPRQPSRPRGPARGSFGSRLPRSAWLVALAALAPLLPLADAASRDAALRELARTRFGSPAPPTPAPTDADRPLERLGRALFFDTRLGSDGRTGCVSCHLPERHGADGLERSPDARGRLTERNSPTVFDAAALPTLRWRGDRRDAAHQAEDSIKGSMGHATVEAIEPRLRALGYGPAFAAAFPDDTSALRAANFARALQAYQLTLVTASAFDRWLAGDDRALSARQRRGLRSFVERGCAACHDGPQFGGRQFHKFGLTQDYWLATGSRTPDVGRLAVTGDEADRHVFRVPTLRHVSRTAPYFHDGSVASLREAVRLMARLQLGVVLPPDELDALVDLLGALDGPVPPQFAAPEGSTPPAAGTHARRGR